MSSVIIGNRADCCGERLENLQIRAGMKNDLTNDVVGSFDGPGSTGQKYIVRLRKEVIAEYITFQLMKKNATLQIQGIILNKKPGRRTNELVKTIFLSYISFNDN